MRFALDACVHSQVATELRRLGADAKEASDLPAIPDAEIIAAATADDRVLVTADKDFGELVFREGARPPGVVLIRFDVVSVEAAAGVAQRIVALVESGRGAFTVLEAAATRRRPLAAGD